MQVCNDDNNIIEHGHKRMDEREKMICRNFRFHTPLPKASVQQLMNEEKGEQ